MTAIAWVFELARAKRTDTGEYCDWGPPQLSFTEPCVPEGSIRNLRPLGYLDADKPVHFMEPGEFGEGVMLTDTRRAPEHG